MTELNIAFRDYAAARAFSGEVGTGSPQKMRPLKDN
jgi:hypothetical protein